MKRLFYVPVALLVAAPVAHAGYNPEHKADTQFSRLDANADNVVDFEEYTKVVSERFKMIDTDGNDAISKAEMRAFWQKKKEEYEQFKHEGLE